MKILFLGDVVGISGCSKILNNLKAEIDKKKIDFVIINGENSAETGVGLTEKICKDFFNCGVNVITTGDHIIYLNHHQEKDLKFIKLLKI